MVFKTNVFEKTIDNHPFTLVFAAGVFVEKIPFRQKWRKGRLFGRGNKKGKGFFSEKCGLNFCL